MSAEEQARAVSIKDFDRAVTIFQEAWHKADEAGLAGHRTQFGMQALIKAGWAPRQASREVTDAEVNAGGAAIHRAMAPTWMSVVRALDGDQERYEAMLADLARAALVAAREVRS